VCEPTGYGITVWQCDAIPRSRPRVVALPLVRLPLPTPCPHRVPAPVEPAIRHEESTMTVPPEVEAQILRLHHVEKWRRGTIARQLHVHHAAVAPALGATVGLGKG
jgi:hypothetical protein